MPERLKKFLKLHDELRDKVPDSVECARKLAEFVGDPKAEDPEEIWRVLWDKPLYANVSVNVADDWKAQIGPGWRALGCNGAAIRTNSGFAGIVWGRNTSASK